MPKTSWYDKQKTVVIPIHIVPIIATINAVLMFLLLNYKLRRSSVFSSIDCVRDLWRGNHTKPILESFDILS